MPEKKKVGILTFSYSSNPGSVLQAYALQQVLSERYFCDTQIINYQKTQAGKPIIGSTVFCGPLHSWTPRKVAEWCVRIIAHPLRMAKYEKFFNKYYKGYPTKRCSKSDLEKLEDKYDYFIVGSDQVWNFGSWSVDTTYFLDFVFDGSKKISYAASFGSSKISEKYYDLAKNLISEFSSVSVRENYGVDMILDLTGQNASLVLDPSLLLDKEEYRTLSTKPHNKKYLLLYLREDSAELESTARKMAAQKGLEFVKILKHWKCQKNGKPFSPVGPLEWLGYMDNAEYIVTNSFHGICFSIIFEKEFYVGLLEKVSVSTNPRINNILNMFDLDSRYLNNVNNFENMEKIDYGKVNLIKEQLQEKSFVYLKYAIERD